jgi:hypothetical protein
MSKFSEAPGHIFTSYLALSAICITHNDSYVYLYGCYGNLATADIDTIEIETDFETLNTLLFELGDDANFAIEALANSISCPTQKSQTIMLDSKGGLHFEDHLFALMLSRKEDLDDDDEFISYQLNGFMKRDGILPEFDYSYLPSDKTQVVEYYNKVIAVQYLFYLHFKKQSSNEMALILSGLHNPVLFALAKAYQENLSNIEAHDN